MNRIKALGALAALAIGGSSLAQAPASNMSFFVTSKNPGKGGDLGGLKGADAYCQSLAAAAGAGSKTWHAFLSTDKENAKDRIGKGPWYNFKGVLIAQNVADLLKADANKISADTALSEKGTAANYLQGDPPVRRPDLQHDMLTGTNDDGTSSGMTCNNWTDGGDEQKATLGHADRKGQNPGLNSFTSVHSSRGCSLTALEPTGGVGLFYCFATN